MAAHAAALLSPGTRALTHCNAGGLARGGYGSAVGALLAAWERDLLVHVWVDETRPLLQGARLTAWNFEVGRDPACRHRGLGCCVADGRRRGPTSSSLGLTGSRPTGTRRTRSAPTGSRSSSSITGIPFYIVAPSSTVDHATENGWKRIPIEERDPAEVTARFPARNPAFDVTPASLITSIVTEHAVHPPPYVESLAGAVVAAL